ncbi:cilia- and flagella-associated protein 161 isoform X3 [Papio anubis]|uniref:cilia- and flagella-associated protein 161 isoform X3 n=1 Tax=Papio anubis TaxID=9555 RepID=UPI0012ADCAB1|nr:cilia- and flagella-associated protein 161 isoform X3 [Papio anubis]
MAQNLYGPGVRIGNWNEDVYLEEELMKDFLEKRDKGKLLIQRRRRLKQNLLRPMQLSMTEDGYIHYGDKVMLVNPDDPDTEADVFLGGDLSLCMTPDEIQSHLRDELEVPCGLSAVQAKTPIGRNTFIILSVHRDATGQVLRYGQDFCLGITGGFDNKMVDLLQAQVWSPPILTGVSSGSPLPNSGCLLWHLGPSIIHPHPLCAHRLWLSSFLLRASFDPPGKYYTPTSASPSSLQICWTSLTRKLFTEL